MPLAIQIGFDGLLAVEAEVQRQVVLHLVTGEQHGLHDRLADAGFVLGHRHRDTQRLADAFRLSQDHLQHCAIHRIVGAIEHQRAHLGGTLAEAVDTTLALFVAGRVPGQVVMHHRIEHVLQVDTLGQAVGGDHDRRLVDIAQGENLLLALTGAELAGDADHFVILEQRLQGRRHIVGGGDVAAEHHRLEAQLDQRLDLDDQLLELGIVFTSQAGGLVDQAAQALGILLHHRARLDVVAGQSLLAGAIQHGIDAHGLDFRQLDGIAALAFGALEAGLQGAHGGGR
ncbi:hypothetical protein D3C78_435200 [compost metagenome]